MPQKIILVRHGETKDNVERRLQGWTDTPLNANGLAQARALAQKLSSEIIHAIYASDLLRARKTATPLAKQLGLKLTINPSLREHNMGIFEGWQWETEPDPIKQQLWADLLRARACGDIHWKATNSESLAEFTTRVKNFLDHLAITHQHQTVVLVTHGGTINRILEIYRLKKITDEYFGYLNTSVTILAKHGQSYQLTLHNDISHL